jgi:hypothetical protein
MIMGKSGPKRQFFAFVGYFFTSTYAMHFSIGCIGPSENTEKNRVFNTFGRTDLKFGRMVRIGRFGSRY